MRKIIVKKLQTKLTSKVFISKKPKIVAYKNIKVLIRKKAKVVAYKNIR
jgi:hypothetical protein